MLQAEEATHRGSVKCSAPLKVADHRRFLETLQRKLKSFTSFFVKLSGVGWRQPLVQNTRMGCFGTLLLERKHGGILGHRKL